MKDPRIRLRSPKQGDESDLADLCSDLGYPSNTAEIAERLLALAKRDDHSILVAIDEGERAIGFVHVRLNQGLLADVIADLGGLVVRKGKRGKGLGERLLAEAERWARSKGAKILRVGSDAVRERAHRFYLREGYVQSKTSLVFEKSLN